VSSVYRHGVYAQQLPTSIVPPRRVGAALPVVVRMEGTNVEEGRRILAESAFRFHMAADMKAAAGMVASLLQGAGSAAGKDHG